MDRKLHEQLLAAQKNEITEHLVYKKLSGQDAKNRKTLKRISDDELSHYKFFLKHTGKEVKPSTFNLWKYYLMASIFGLTFAVKLMERGEKRAQINYSELAIKGIKDIEKDEEEHEKKLIGLLDEERLKYVSSIVLGLNDALVELTGSLAGFTLALANSSLIAMTGLIVGIAAAMSMAASEYLSVKSGDSTKTPFKSSIYTGIAYIFTVLLLILPFLLLDNVFIALGLTFTTVVVIILFFTYYISVVNEVSFSKRFLEMAAISIGVALLSFGIGYLVKVLFGISV
ncbi:MAG TPA: VIT1/CCC1 family protein [Candidatus Nanoarchaeia archaeon]|nr:VIT1/CCC1 family protein [Candidatus Nanoarchaeia archaeon]